MLFRLLALGSFLLAVSACGESPSETSSELQRLRKPSLIARGAEVFATHCAACHGTHAEGVPQWRVRDAGGMFPPPPLNGTAHAWHHPLADLRRIIREGSVPGKGRMPAWKSTLTGQDIDAAIAWFQSRWPPEVYAAWLEIDARSRGGLERLN